MNYASKLNFRIIHPVKLGFARCLLLALLFVGLSSAKPLAQENVDWGASFAVEHITFNQDEAQVLQSSYDELNKLAKHMQKKPQLHVLITAHTSNTDTIDWQQKLSKRRAEAVKNYLIAQGIAANRILAKGVGSSQPLEGYDPDSKIGREANNRVEGRFWIKKK